MSDGEDYGDLDDTAFFEAATQAENENENIAVFLESPRPTKRRKLEKRNDTTGPIPSRCRRPSGRHDLVIDSEDEDGVNVISSATSLSADEKRTHSRSASANGTKTRKRQTPARQLQTIALEDDDEQDGSPRKTLGKRKQDRIHTPSINLDMEESFSTQPPSAHSPPWKTRGAIWQKPGVSIGVHRPCDNPISRRTGLDAPKSKSLPGRESISSRQVAGHVNKGPTTEGEEAFDTTPLPAVKSRVEEYDPAKDLADLPSDAFASSSSPQRQDEDVEVLSEKRTRLVAPQTGLRQTTLFGRQGLNGEVPQSQVNKRHNYVVDVKDEPPTHHKLDLEAMKTWVYPANLGKRRTYQFNIVAKALYHNLLVALPTGLGKTFIAATVMLNWYRWTKEAQIVFVAPTKPLVSQQVEACFNIAGIPRSQTTLLTGGVAVGLRAEEWASKRVFFMTPQTLKNDLASGIADPKKIVLLVVDEAHKATGSYAYVEVVSLMRRFNPSFRVLALTATPGADVEAVQKVIDGLDIAKIEIRTEYSIDIREYVHHRKVESEVFENSDEMAMCMELYSEALKPLVDKVAGLNAFYSRDPLDLTPYGCTQARQRYFASDAGKHAHQGVKFMVNNIFTILASVSHGMELLKYHGIGSFYTKMKEFKDSQAERKSKYRKEICDSEAFKQLMVRLHAWVRSKDFIGHPKLEFLQGAILDHFVNAGKGRNVESAPPSQTRIMVFAHFRDSAEEIVRVLKRHEPMVRPSVFVGQASAKNSEGMQQKEQLNVIEKFRKGVFNTLVATSIGEEGLDIGEVDLIICYDSKASPIRMLQRMGRTGRKREGKIILLQMKGKEEKDLEKAKDAYEKMQHLISEGKSFRYHDDVSRRIVPHDVSPELDERVVEIPVENSQTDFLPEPRKNGRAPKRPPKRFHMPDGVVAGFVSAGRMDQEITPKPRIKKTTTIYPSEQLAEIPSLETVLLQEAAMKDLEHKYQTVYDEDDAPIIRDLNFGSHTARRRILSQVKYINRHGRVTEGFVKTLQRMHAMNDDRLAEFRSRVAFDDLDTDPTAGTIVPDGCNADNALVTDVDVWEEDDPASQPQPTARTQPAPKIKARAASRPTTPKITLSKATVSGITPRKAAPASIKQTAPVRQPRASVKHKTSIYSISDLVDEGAASSPPPTDPRMRIASQAESLGSDDTVGPDDVNDTQAYLLDSDLRDFIAEDEEEVEVPNSSLPSLDLSGVGRGTQAIVRSARSKRPKKAEKIFTSDPTDDDAVVSSDSVEMPIANWDRHSAKESCAAMIDSSTEDEDAEPVVRPKKRIRRIVVDQDEDD